MRNVQRFAVAALVAAVSFQSADAQKLVTAPPPQSEEQGRKRPTEKEVLTDVAIVALIIVASIAAYKAMGKPCACPEDRMSNGAQCGNRSAYRKPGGYAPLCYPADVTTEMIRRYRETNAASRLK